MSMLLIDCYNFLHTDMPMELAGLDELGLCNHLAKTKFRRQKTVLVCDGVVKPGGLTQSPYPCVKLQYSGKNMTADEVIIQLVNMSTGPRGITVVTNDREIQQAVRRRKAKVLSCEAFVTELHKEVMKTAQSSGPARDRRGNMSERELAEWANEFDIDLEDDGLLDDMLAELNGSEVSKVPDEDSSKKQPKLNEDKKPQAIKPQDLLYSDDDLEALEDELKDLPGFKDL